MSREPLIGRSRKRTPDQPLLVAASLDVAAGRRTEIARPPTEGDGLAVMDHGDPFLERFTVVIPDDYSTGLPPDLSQEQRNQEAMFLIRQAFLQSPSGRQFAWVPQAIEALRRSLTSDFLPDFGTIREISIDPSSSEVDIMTQARNPGAEPFNFPTNLEVLEGFSIERLLGTLDAETPLEAVEYSAEMAREVAELSPSAQYRWDLVTRAARHAAEGRNTTEAASFAVEPVVNDHFLNMVNGLGIFLHNNRQADTRRWSVVKLVGEDVPVTDQEARFFDQAYAAVPPDRFAQNENNFYEFVYAVWNEIGQRGEFTYEQQQGMGARLKAVFDKTFRPKSDNALFLKLQDICYRLQQQRIDSMAPDTMLTLQTRVSAAVMRDKARFTGEQPFECTRLPEALEAELQATAQQTLAILTELDALLRQHAADFLKMLPPLPNEADDRYRHGLGTKARAGLENIQQALTSEDHPTPLIAS